MTLSTPVKIVALAALALVLGLGGVMLLLGHKTSPSSDVVVPPVVHHTAHATVTPTPKPKPHKAPLYLDPSLPLVVRRALEHRSVAIVAIYSSRSASDRAVLAEARAGSRTAHAGFVAANVARDGIATAVAGWSNRVSVPAVLVVRRPGKIVFAVNGVTDRATIAQAATTAR